MRNKIGAVLLLGILLGNFFVNGHAVATYSNANLGTALDMPSQMSPVDPMNRSGATVPCYTPRYNESTAACKRVYLATGSTGTLTGLGSTVVRAYFSASSGSLRIYSPNFCGDDDDAEDDSPKTGSSWVDTGGAALPDAVQATAGSSGTGVLYRKYTPVTSYTFADGTVSGYGGEGSDNVSASPNTVNGVVRYECAITGDARADGGPITVNLVNMPQDPTSKLYYTTITARDLITPAGQFTGIVNNFYYDGGTNLAHFGYVPYTNNASPVTNVGLNPQGKYYGTNAGYSYSYYTDIFVDFYTPQSGALPNNKLAWFDLDQNNGADSSRAAVPYPNRYTSDDSQPYKVWMSLEMVDDATGQTSCDASIQGSLMFRNSSATLISAGTDCTFTPELQSGNDYATFAPQYGKHYRWIIHRVYQANVIQFAVPYPSVPPTSSVELNVNPGSIDHERGAGNQTVSVEIKICDYSGSTHSATLTLINSATGAIIPNSPIVLANITDNCGVSINPADIRTVTVSGAAMDALAVGANTAIARLAYGSVPPATDTFSINVFEVPYMRVYGNDAYISNSCPGAASAQSGKIALNSLTAPADNIRGGAGQFAMIGQQPASLINPIAAASAMFRTASPAPPDGLATLWGSAAPICGSNPASQITDTYTTINAASTTFDLSSATTGYYRYTGAGPLTLTGAMQSGRKVTVDATSAVVIAAASTPLAQPVPFNDATASVLLINATGDIYINSGVSYVEAILRTAGTLHTCSNGAAVPATSTWHVNCRSKLRIYGSVQAASIEFARSIGTRLLAATNEQATQPQGNDSAAEVIEFPPYLYFVTPYLKDQSTSTFKSMYSAAPYF